MVIILIAGASASGKSQLAANLVKQLLSGGVSAAQLKMDDYYYPKPDDAELIEYKTKTNLDKPDMIEFELIIQHLCALSRGEIIDRKPVLDFATCARLYERFQPSEVLVVEGIFALHLTNKLPADIKTVTVSVTTTSYLDILRRREKRDIDEGRRKTVDEVRYRERRNVGHGFFAYVAPSFSSADIQIVNEEHVDPAKPHPLEMGAVDIVAILNQLDMLKHSQKSALL